MVFHNDIDPYNLRAMIRRKEIVLAGNNSLKIYGMLNCSSGKRLNKTNRVFFESLDEALHSGFRPCGHCMKEAYRKWHNAAF